MDNRKTKLGSLPTNIRGLLAAVAFVTGMLMANSAFALPSLQLGPDCDPGGTSSCGDWTYVGGNEDTWFYNGTQPLTLNAYANAVEGGNGKYAWATEPVTPGDDQYAYLVLAATPKQGNANDVFDVTVTNNGVELNLVASGFGSPPVQDDNSLAGHGIFDTYFEIYEFKFDEDPLQIGNTQPPPPDGSDPIGGGDPGQGYKESFLIDWKDPLNGLEGIHADLFTVSNAAGGNQYDPSDPTSDKFLVQSFAPFSHDAQITPPGGTPPSGIPEPGLAALFSMGLLGMGLSHYRRKRKIS